MTKPSNNGGQLIKILEDLNIPYRTLTDIELQQYENYWVENFISNKLEPELESFKWHVFSFNKTNFFEGHKAIKLFQEQFPTTLIVFNEELNFGIEFQKNNEILHPLMKNNKNDLYICHHNLKWTFVLTHEHPDFGPYFKFREK